MAAREAQVAAGGPGLGGLPGLAGDAGHRLVVSAVRHHAPHPRLAVFFYFYFSAPGRKIPPQTPTATSHPVGQPTRFLSPRPNTPLKGAAFRE